MTDKAIEYETKLYQVSRVINSLKKIGLDTAPYEEILETIKSDCQKETTENLRDKILSDAEAATSSIAVSYVEAAYNKAIGKLGKLLYELNKYEVYLRVASFSHILHDFIKKEEKDTDKIIEMRATLVRLLEDLKRSGTLSYEIEGHLVKDIYGLTYDFIKEEIKIMGSSPTLALLKADDIHKYNLDKYIVHELENLDLNELKYSRVSSIKNNLDMDGIDASYLDEELIKALISAVVTSEYYEKKLESLDEQVQKYYNEIRSLNRDLINTKEKEKNIKVEWKDLLKPLALLLTSISIASGLVFGAFKLSKGLTKERKYKTEKTTIDTLTEKEKTEELYLANKKDKTLFLKVNPYQETSEGFKRIITSYNVTDITGMSEVLDYLELDFDALGIKGKDIEEEKETLTPEDLYEKMYYAIESYKIDENDYKDENEPVNFGFAIFFFEFLAVALYVLFEAFYYDHSNLYTWSVKEHFEDIIDAISDIKDSKKDIKTKKAQIKEIQEQMKKLFAENKDIIIRALSLLPELKTRPEFQERAEELENVIKRVRKIEVDNSLE